MRGGAVTFLSILLFAAASGCSRDGNHSTKSPFHPGNSPASIAQLPAAAASGRIFLTKAQLSQALASGTVDRPIKSLLAVDRPLTYGEYKWNDTAIPDGPTWVRIDLGTQLISVFRGGHEIGTSVIVYGGDNKQTPVGKLHILAKARDHRSSLYDASMPYTLRLTNDGVSIHGSAVRWGAATHGCIGVPLDFARRLFDATKIGDEVIILPANPGPTSRTS
jgi:lipoprotein-anchoring transpeptidase ErfK/SrfK